MLSDEIIVFVSNRRQAKMKSRIVERYRVIQTQYDYINDVTRRLGSANRWVFKHILASQLIQRELDFIPVPSDAMEKFKPTRGFNYLEMKNSGLVEMLPFNKEKGICRRYRIRGDIMNQFIALGSPKDNELETLEAFRQQKRVNLFDGKTMPRQKRSKRYNPVNKNKYPKLIKQALDVLNVCYFNEPQLNEFYKAYEQNHLSKISQIRLPVQPGSDEDKEYKKIMGKWNNFLTCKHALLDRTIEETTKTGIKSFVPIYEVVSTGRLKWELQHAPRAMKHALYTGIPQLKNYDVYCCHGVILDHLMTEAGIYCHWLKDYLNNPSRKEEYAKRLGMTVDTWKKCFFGILYGAFLPPNITYSDGALRKALDNEFPEHQIQAKCKALLKEVKLFLGALDQWHTHIVNSYFDTHKCDSGRNTCAVNKAGMTFNQNEFKALSPHEQKSRLAAFILQGYESAFIHKLTVLGRKYNYQPIANEHDGLVVIGEIPMNAINEARDYVGVNNLQVNEKPFV